MAFCLLSEVPGYCQVFLFIKAICSTSIWRRRLRYKIAFYEFINIIFLKSYNIIFSEFACQENLILSVGKSLQREIFAQLPENCFENSLQV